MTTPFRFYLDSLQSPINLQEKNRYYVLTLLGVVAALPSQGSRSAT